MKTRAIHRLIANGHKIDSVFVAKGIAITLVVIGHYTPASLPFYWEQMRNVIYAFHMPFFFMLSGYLYGLSPPPPGTYSSFLKKKAHRLLIPYFSISVLFLLAKIAAGVFFKLQFPVTLHSIRAIFINPLDSFLPLLWFIYTLFILFMIFPVLCSVVHNNLSLLLVLSLLLYFFGIRTAEFCLVQFFHNLPAFTIGFAMGYARINFDEMRVKNVWPGLILSVLCFSFAFIYKDIHQASTLVFDLVLYISGSFACLALSILIHVSHCKATAYIKIAGVYSMSIYLLHTMFSSMVRIGFYQVLGLPQSKFLLGAIVAVTLGILLPLLIEKYILRKYGIPRRLFLGLE